MKTLYFDCGCGASGDMIVGALVDAGASFDKIKKALETLGVGHFHVTSGKIVKRGISATHFQVHVEHHHHHPHRHLADVLEIIERGELPDEVKAAATETFRRIAECEASIHGTTPDHVHFHEVGAVDSICDIISAHYALHLLDVDHVMASPLNVGSGTVEVAHGVMPVPAPATALLLTDAPSYGSSVPFELVTPTGAALITQWAKSYGPMPPMRVQAIGYGSGTRELDDRPNVLRAMIGEETIQADTCCPGGETVTVIEVNIDDINPELLPPLVADLLKNGARDAFLTAILGKKGRPAYLVTVLCDEPAVPALSRVLFEGTTTFGLRMRQERRICLDREWKQAETPWGRVAIKVGKFNGVVTTMSPEFEDCRQVAEAAGVPVMKVYDAARAAAVKGELIDA